MFDKLLDRLAALLLNNARLARHIRRVQITREMEVAQRDLDFNLSTVAEEEARGNFNYKLGHERIARNKDKLHNLFHEYVCM